MTAVFDMSGEASEGALLLARIDERTARSEKIVVALDEMIRGDGKDTGLVGSTTANRDAIRAIRQDVTEIRAQLALKMFPKRDETKDIKTRAEAFAIRAGVALAFLTAIIEAWQWFTSTGGTP